MQSNNPVFRRSEDFNRAGGAGQAQTYAGYGQPAQWSTGQPGGPLGYDDQRPAATAGGQMTIDTVVQKTAVTLGIVIAVAIATWIVTPAISSTEDLGTLYAAMTVGMLSAFVLGLVNSFKRVVSPALVIAFAVAEGVAMGALSKFIDSIYSTPDSGNLVVQAVIGTFAAFAGTLTAYKVFNIQVGQKFRMFVIAAAFGMLALGLLELVLSLFSSQMGLFGFGALGMVTAIIGLVLGVFFLILDFDFVEQGVRNGLPERESWRAAFGITLSLVYIYTNLLRLLAIFSSD